MSVLRVNVEQEDIDSGEPGVKGQCAIAHAIKRQYPDLGYLSVTKYHIRAKMLDLDTWFTWVQPEPEFIRTFDKDKSKAKPFTLTLNTRLADTEYSPPNRTKKASSPRKPAATRDPNRPVKRKKLR